MRTFKIDLKLLCCELVFVNLCTSVESCFHILQRFEEGKVSREFLLNEQKVKWLCKKKNHTKWGKVLFGVKL